MTQLLVNKRYIQDTIRAEPRRLSCGSWVNESAIQLSDSDCFRCVVGAIVCTLVRQDTCPIDACRLTRHVINKNEKCTPNFSINAEFELSELLKKNVYWNVLSVLAARIIIQFSSSQTKLIDTLCAKVEELFPEWVAMNLDDEFLVDPLPSGVKFAEVYQ